VPVVAISHCQDNSGKLKELVQAAANSKAFTYNKAVYEPESCVIEEDYTTNYHSALSYVNRKSGYVRELSKTKIISSSNENQSKPLAINSEVKPALFQKIFNVISFSSKTDEKSANTDEYSERIIEAANTYTISTSKETELEQENTLLNQILVNHVQNDAIYLKTRNGGATAELCEEDNDYYSWRNMPISRPAPSSHIVSKAYTPTCPDEMTLLTGDIIGIETVYDDGWARAQNISQGGKRCMVPMNFLSFIKTGPSQNVVNGAPTPLQYDKRNSVFNDIVAPRITSKRRDVRNSQASQE
jgi:hypothetical protein